LDKAQPPLGCTLVSMARPRRNLAERYEQCRVDLLANAEAYHTRYYEDKTFGGPSLHFHRRSIGFSGEAITSQRLEYIYATLASWGMHRMGRGGSKMVEFGDFEASVMRLREPIARAVRIDILDVDAEAMQLLEDIFLNLRVMKSATTLVGNSKVMAHLLPQLVPPIDREYTLRVLHGDTTILNDPQREWQTMREMLERFFWPVAKDATIRRKCEEWMRQPDKFQWDTSFVKIVDNLVIGCRKHRADTTPRKPKRRKRA
jgi:hypothetical protein